MRRISFLTICTLFALAAQAATVRSVNVRAEGDDSKDVSDVLALCMVKPGAEYNAVKCSNDISSLRDTGNYENVSVEITPEGDQVDITYVVKRKLRFAGPPEIMGADYWGEKKIASLAGLKDGQMIDKAQIESAAMRIRDAYRKEYFKDVTVKYSTETKDGAVNVTFEINEGARVKYGHFEFEGNGDIDALTLREAINDYPWWNPVGWFADKPVTELALEEARQKIAKVFRDAGYLDVVVEGPAVKKSQNGDMAQTFTITKGPLYKIGRLDVKSDGDEVSHEESLTTAAKILVEGTPAGEKTLSSASEAITKIYGRKGFADTRAVVKRIDAGGDVSNRVINIVIDISKGEEIEINNILVRNNDKTKDKVIRREIILSPGDKWNADNADRTKRRLENMRYFERVRYYLEDVRAEDAVPSAKKRKNLVYEVSEQSTGNFGFGVGASSVDSVYGMVELSESNFDLFKPWRFNGGGQKARASLQIGPRIQTYEIGLTEPWFMDRPLEFTADIYRRQRWYDQYDVIRSGASAGISYPVKFLPSQKTASGRLGFSATLDFVQLDDVDSGLWSHNRNEIPTRPLYKIEDSEYGDAFEAIFRVYWSDDRRDNYLIPKRGYKALIFADLALGDNQWWKVGFNYSHYFTVSKTLGHVLSFRIRGETIDAFSDDVPIYDRMFLGGPRSIRGVEYREIAPRVWRGNHHEAWGGQTLLCATAEYTIPVPKVDILRFAVFTDMGSVGKDAFDPDFSNFFTWSVGVGLRLDIPSFPIRLDFATPIEKPDDTEKEVFSFSVGYDL